MNLKMRAAALAAEGLEDESQRTWLAAAQEVIAQLIVDPNEFGFGEALACITSARRPLLGKEKVRQRVQKLMKVTP